MHKVAKRYSNTLTCKLSQGFGRYLLSLSLKKYLLACIAAGIALIALGYTSSCDTPWLSLLMFCLFAAGIGAASNGFYTSMVSIAPPFVGILSSISKMFALLGMLSTPYIVTAFRKEVTPIKGVSFLGNNGRMACDFLCYGFNIIIYGSVVLDFWKM